jgi:gamma-glutamylcyclotransferase
MAFLFQYGSNMSTERLNDSCRLRGDARAVGKAITEEVFQLTFDLWSEKAEPPCASADIINGAGRKIWGIVYEIPDYLIKKEDAAPRNRKSMDQIEGQNYERRIIKLRWPDGHPVTDAVITYVGRPSRRKKKIRTTFNYVEHILRGMREHHIPNEYVDYVRSVVLESNPDLRPQLFRNVLSFWLFLARRLL